MTNQGTENSENTLTAPEEKPFSFRNGWNQVKNGDLTECRRDIMEAIGSKSRQVFYNWLAGAVEPRVTQKEAIEAAFAKYGVTENIWGK